MEYIDCENTRETKSAEGEHHEENKNVKGKNLCTRKCQVREEIIWKSTLRKNLMKEKIIRWEKNRKWRIC